MRSPWNQKSIFPKPANSMLVQVMSEFSFSNIQEADSYIDEWLYDVCKCDGGFSSYAQRTVNRRSKTARREVVQPQILVEKRA
jgi:hypothetical protein|tara:strand:- start:469 stop:717 length:249 start_codon:yes stop_codon:yes gene_type:complete